MKSISWNNKYIGLFAGIFFTLIGFSIFGLVFSYTEHVTFSYFLNEVFLNRSMFKLHIITISVIFNVIPFYIALKKNKIEFAKGLMIVLVLGVIAGVIYYD